MRSANPSLSPAEVQEVLKLSADDIGPPGWDPESGWGRVNAAGAVSLALGYEAVPDTTAPQVAIVDPAADEVLHGMATVLVEASDLSEVSQVDL